MNMKIKKFNDFKINEKVQDEWFENNPDFYISRNKEDRKEDELGKIEDDKKIKQLYNDFKKVNFNDIQLKFSDGGKYSRSTYDVVYPEFIRNRGFDKCGFEIFKNDFLLKEYQHGKEQNYKLILSLLKNIKRKLYNIGCVSKEIVNEFFKNNDDYFSMYYLTISNTPYLILTKNKDAFLKMVNEVKKDPNNKIVYFNNKTKGKEVMDYDVLKINKIKNELKNIDYKDISYQLIEPEYRGEVYGYHAIFKDNELNNKIEQYDLIPLKIFQKDRYNNFGITERYHVPFINNVLRGVGIGYKLYKSFLKFKGYLGSDEHTSISARKIYYHLMKDEDVYCVIDENGIIDEDDDDDVYNQCVLLIWKKNPKLKELIENIRKFELDNNKHYQYDKELLKYLDK